MADNNEVVDLIKARMERQEALPKSVPIPVNGNGSDAPPPKDFAFHLRAADGTEGITLNMNGYLIVSAVFMGCGTIDGIITGCVPIENILYVEEVDLIPPSAATAA